MKQFKILFLLTIFLFSFDASFAQKHKTDKDKSSGYDYQGPFNDGLARVRKKAKEGFIDTTGNVVVPLKYNQVENFSDGLARVRTGNKWGLVDKLGNEISPPTFDYIYEFIDGVARVPIDGVDYWMNKKGQRVPKPGSKPDE